MTPLLRCVSLAGLALACACSPVRVAEPTAASGTAAPGSDVPARAPTAMAAFGGRLRSELGVAMQRDGALGAVDFCHEQAPLIADQVMAEHGVRLGRMAIPGRNRNPGNVASGWQAAVLADFQAAVDGGGAPETQVRVIRENLPDGVELRMARGIRVEPACLACHGSTVAPELKARINQRYPQDRAMGFSEGDLRGLIWAEVSTVSEATP